MAITSVKSAKEAYPGEMLTLPDYFADVAEELGRKADGIRRDFATHRLSGGENKEELIGALLRDYLPNTFGVDTGLIISQSGEFSNQADLLVVDQAWNAPLYPTSPNRIWLVEAVYAMFEIKTSLNPSEISDALHKCRRFKTLPREFDSAPTAPNSADSLFVLWAFEGPSPETIQQNVRDAFEGIPRREQPDFVVVQNSVICTAGSYRSIVTWGMPGSEYREELLQMEADDIENMVGERVQVWEMGNHTLLAFIGWFTSWLKRVGPRSAPLYAYLDENRTFGREL